MESDLLARASQPRPRQHKESQLSGADGVDCFAASGHALGEVEEVQAQLRAAMRRAKTRMRNLRPLSSSPWSKSNTLAVNTSRRSETTRWHTPDSGRRWSTHRQSCSSRIELQQWVDTKGRSIIQSSARQDVEAAWLPLPQRIHNQAKKIAEKRKRPREQRLTGGTWEIMCRRSWLVDSLWSEKDIAEVRTW